MISYQQAKNILKKAKIRIYNEEILTTKSLNRILAKDIFSPHRDKKIGEFFEPITLRKVSELAINYKLPKINQ